MKLILLAITIAIALTGCDYQPSADQVSQQKQEKLAAEGNAEVGMPAIVNFQEKRNLKMIQELRDTALSTVTYTQDLAGKLHKLCDSVGYGIPAATQYTNPKYTTSHAGVYITLPQADPNGLFSPASADGTWVLCLNPDTKKMAPVYVEPRVIVSPFTLQ